MEEMQSALERLGFSKNESKVYLCLLKNGELTATSIAKKSSVERTHVYYILESLMAKGLASSNIQHNAQNFSAASPKKIQEKIKEEQATLDAIMPTLNEMQSMPE